MIDIIIPAYNSHKTIDRTLSSIAYQTISDKINVYIVNDGSKKDYSDFVKLYSNFINIKEIKLEENMGPGYAREVGIKSSKSKYIIFIDSDDVFYENNSVQMLFELIDNNDVDMVKSLFFEETLNGFIEKHNDNIWLHGKIYKRDFIIKNDIHFTNTKSNEDIGFNQQFYLADAKIMYIDKLTYYWLNNNTSITRKNNYEYRLKCLDGYLYNNKYAIEKSLENKNTSMYKISKLSYEVLCCIYIYYLEYGDNSFMKKILKKTKDFLSYIKLFKISENEILNILGDHLNQMMNDDNRKYLLMQRIPFDEFLKEVDNI